MQQTIFNSTKNQSITQSLTRTPYLPVLSSRIAFIFISASAAIGLGNIWKFPYMVGVHGGSAFVLLYFICILLVGLPTMMAEIFIGYKAKLDPINSYKALSRSHETAKFWQLGGIVALLTSFIALSFYSVVAGWAVGYAILCLKQSYAFINQASVQETWHTFLQSPSKLIQYHTFFMVMTLSINALGVVHGIERLSKFALPFLFIILVFLVGIGAYYGDLSTSLHYLFSFRAFELDSSALVSALGHAFFTLAVGGGSMMVYGTYMPKNQCIYRSVMAISIMDVTIALLAGLAIFPLVFAFQLTPEAGPGLMFQVLPIAFGQMPYGYIIGFWFFILLLFSAWTTSIAMVEPILRYMLSKWPISRKKACLYIGSGAWLLGLASVFSFNVWSDLTIWHDKTIFECLTDLVSNVLLPLGGLAVALFVGWGMSKPYTKTAFTRMPDYLFFIWHFVLRYISPLGIIVIMFYALF